MGVSTAAAIALAPLCIPPARAHADDPCVSITDSAAHQGCIDGFLRDNPMRRYQLGIALPVPFTDSWANFVGTSGCVNLRPLPDIPAQIPFEQRAAFGRRQARLS